MSRKQQSRKAQWKRARELEERAFKAWEECEQDAIELLERVFKDRDQSPEQCQRACDEFKAAIIDAIVNQKVEEGIVRVVLLSMVAESLVNQVTHPLHGRDLEPDWLETSAADLGKAMVKFSLELLADKQDAAMN